MIRRPLWFGVGVTAGAAGTVWAERQLRRQLRRAVDAISPTAAGLEARDTVREASARVQLAVRAARNERRRREAELWHRLGVDVPRAPLHRSRGATTRPTATRSRHQSR